MEPTFTQGNSVESDISSVSSLKLSLVPPLAGFFTWVNTADPTRFTNASEPETQYPRACYLLAELEEVMTG